MMDSPRDFEVVQTDFGRGWHATEALAGYQKSGIADGVLRITSMGGAIDVLRAALLLLQGDKN